MKYLFKSVLVLSLVLNAVVLGWMVRREPTPVLRPVVPAAVPTAETVGPRAPRWQDLPADDLPALVEQLRQSGFPPSLVRAIAAVRLREQYANRRRVIERGADERFWIAPDNDAVATQVQALRREERDALRQLLGEDLSPEEQALSLEVRGLGFVAPERTGAVATLLRDFDEQRRQLFDAMGATGGAVPFDANAGAKLEALDKAQRAELARVLTPEELERYDLTAGRTATRLRSEMMAFQPTEEEYRSIFKLQQTFDEQWGTMSMATASEADRRARFEAQRQLREQVKLQLGPERGADYERAADPNYRMAAQLVSRLQLPASTAGDLYQVQKDMEAQMNQRRSVNEDMPAWLARLDQEAVTRVGALIGEKNVDTYRRYGGMWMSALKMNPAGNNRGSPPPVLRPSTGG